MPELTFKIPENNVFLSFEADAVALRYYQQVFREIPDGKGVAIADGIEKYLKQCKARQNFIIISSDDRIEINTSVNHEEFLTNNDMEIK